MAVIPYNRVQLLADLKSEEGFRGLLYDDKTGAALKPGMRIVGHPTAGYGLALDVDPLTEAEAAWLLSNRAAAHVAAMQKIFPWVVGLSDARQRATYDLSFNLGDHGISSFATFIHLMQTGDFEAAADDLAGTLWARQVGSRAIRIVGLIRAG